MHLLCGSTGAGKTTYARALADEIGAARFAIDEWMTTLFWMDAAEPIDPDWSIERVRRCAALMWTTALDVARRGTPCILEAGLTTRAERARWATLAAADGVPIRLHWLDVPAAERWRRVEARNRERDAGQLAFPITRELFDFVEAMWEPPGDDELAAMNSVRVAEAIAQGPATS